MTQPAASSASQSITTHAPTPHALALKIQSQTTMLQHYGREYTQHDERDDLLLLLNALQQSCKVIGSWVRVAPIEGLLGLTGERNSMNEEVQKLDILANDYFIETMRRCGKVAAMVSEENAEVIQGNQDAPYIVCFDPIDGSSNIEVAIPVGTIFAVYRRKTQRGQAVDVERDILQPGRDLMLAGYSIYGSCTSIVIANGAAAASGKQVNGFTLDPISGEFVLSHPNMRIKKKGKVYSVNEGNSAQWDEGTKQYVEAKKDISNGATPYSLRYVGSMIADVHRTLLSGGLFLYPADKKSPSGKLRLLYECNPMSIIVETAGGLSTTGKERILDINPSKIHQRVPIILGSQQDVEEYLAFVQKNQQ